MLNNPGYENRVLFYIPWYFCFMAGLVLWEKYQRFNPPKFLIDLGAISFSIYIIHIPLLEVLDRILFKINYSPLHLTSLPKFIFYFGCVVAAASITYLFIEKKLVTIQHNYFQFISFFS